MSQSQNRPANALFFSGIHMDIMGKLAAPAIKGASNPGKLSRMPGGASLNCASVARQLGLQSAIIGKVGDDEDGRQIRRVLQKRGLMDLLTSDPNHPTGNYVSLINPDGELEIAFNDLTLNESMQAHWLWENYSAQMRSSDIWVLNANLNTQTLNQLTVSDFASRPEIIAAATISRAKSKHLSGCLANLDVLFTNITEASALLVYRDTGYFDGNNLPPQQCVEGLMQSGVKMGSLSQGSGNLWIWQNGEVHEFEPPSLQKIVDVTGAGDALAGALIAGFANGDSLAETAPIAIAAAQMIISASGPWHKDLCMEELKLVAGTVRQIR